MQAGGDVGEKKVPPRFELGLSDSESEVLTVTPRNLGDVLHTFIHI